MLLLLGDDGCGDGRADRENEIAIVIKHWGEP
jgi:hypothetical protein